MDLSESLLSFDGDVEINAGGFVGLFACDTLHCGWLLAGLKKG